MSVRSGAESLWPEPRSTSRLGVEVSVLREAGSITSISGASWPPRSVASEAGSSMTDGVVCTSESVDRGSAAVGRGERMEEALWLTSRASLY